MLGSKAIRSERSPRSQSPGANASQETATSYSKLGQVDGRMTTEELNRETKAGKFAVIVKDRIMIEAEGTGASIDQLKTAVAAVDLGHAEALAKYGDV
jgi:hypothetical protein